MDKDPVTDAVPDIAGRKEQLLRQGEFYRVGIVHSKAQVKRGLRPDALLHSAVDQAGWMMRSRMDGMFSPGGISLTKAVPLALSVLGYLRKRGLSRPALGAVAGVGAALAGLAWYLNRRRQQSGAGSH